MNAINTEDRAEYIASCKQGTAQEDAIIAQARDILEKRLYKTENFKTSCPDNTKSFLALSLAEREHEIFGVLFLNNQHELIENVELFRGTIDGASVYPREVVKAALECNAAAVIFYHNHPSGLCEPTQADKTITRKLKTALETVEIRSLDHIIVAKTTTYSFAEAGLI